MSCQHCHYKKLKFGLCQHQNIKSDCQQCCARCQQHLTQGITSYQYCHPKCFTSYCNHGFSKNECYYKDCRFNKNFVESNHCSHPFLIIIFVLVSIYFI